MGLKNLSIRQFRCFTSVDIELSPHLNVIRGKNASGKTTILEAVFLLSRGRSFRTAHLQTTLREGSAKFQLAAMLAREFAPIEISLTRKDGFLEPKVAGKATPTLSELAYLLPVQLLDGEANQLIQGGPKSRRQFLDWGAFHVEPTFYETWQRYHRALRHRSSLLKTNHSLNQIALWDIELAIHGEKLDEIRRRYFQGLRSQVVELAVQALGGVDISLGYRRGWSEGESLTEALRISLNRDRLTGITHAGPHRADLVIHVDGRPAQETTSRGQQKVLAAALLLAQADLYQKQTGLACTLLVDDLAAELDVDHLERLLQSIRKVGNQVVMTSIEPLPIPTETGTAWFHVKQGECRPMV